MTDPGAIYVVTFTIGPVEQPASVGLRIAELIAVLKRDPDMADVEVRITRAETP
jgi:hypothetical protein